MELPGKERPDMYKTVGVVGVGGRGRAYLLKATDGDLLELKCSRRWVPARELPCGLPDAPTAVDAGHFPDRS